MKEKDIIIKKYFWHLWRLTSTGPVYYTFSDVKRLFFGEHCGEEARRYLQQKGIENLRDKNGKRKNIRTQSPFLENGKVAMREVRGGVYVFTREALGL